MLLILYQEGDTFYGSGVENHNYNLKISIAIQHVTGKSYQLQLATPVATENSQLQVYLQLLNVSYNHTKIAPDLRKNSFSTTLATRKKSKLHLICNQKKKNYSCNPARKRTRKRENSVAQLQLEKNLSYNPLCNSKNLSCNLICNS